jgi:Mrp family chromosome partitioning ATPase
VALTDPKGLGAEKFRALVARLENLRQKGELKSLQITSAVINEGKSLVAANLAVTLVKHFGYKVLLLEGDLHRPTLTTLLGLTNLEGINQWWRKREEGTKLLATSTNWMICHCGFSVQAPRAISHRKFCNRPDLRKRSRD